MGNWKSYSENLKYIDLKKSRPYKSFLYKDMGILLTTDAMEPEEKINANSTILGLLFVFQDNLTTGNVMNTLEERKLGKKFKGVLEFDSILIDLNYSYEKCINDFTGIEKTVNNINNKKRVLFDYNTYRFTFIFINNKIISCQISRF
jgi:hypothetical protein